MRSLWTEQKSEDDEEDGDQESTTCSLVPANMEDWPWIWALRDTSLLDWKAGLTVDEIQAQALRQEQLPVEIVPQKLYLGNAQSIRDVDRLQELGITAVLTMAGGSLALRAETRKQMDAEDDPGYPLLDNHWKDAYDFIQTHLDDDGGGNNKCVVHCMAGMNRSALVLSAY